MQRDQPITWAQAEWGYRCYAALYGTAQSLNRLAERAGFGTGEILFCARDVLSRAADAENRVALMRSRVRGLPLGERTPEVPVDLAEQIDALLNDPVTPPRHAPGRGAGEAVSQYFDPKTTREHLEFIRRLIEGRASRSAILRAIDKALDTTPPAGEPDSA